MLKCGNVDHYDDDDDLIMKNNDLMLMISTLMRDCLLIAVCLSPLFERLALNHHDLWY